jgi:hypothetical protein
MFDFTSHLMHPPRPSPTIKCYIERGHLITNHCTVPDKLAWRRFGDANIAIRCWIDNEKGLVSIIIKKNKLRGL